MAGLGYVIPPHTPHDARAQSLALTSRGRWAGADVVGSNEGLSIITSGGGFSYVATRPTWQSTHVAAYLAKSGLAFPPTTTYNTNGT
jgi:hypothetical protein